MAYSLASLQLLIVLQHLRN